MHIAIVGAGPAGSQLAFDLSRAGAQVTLLDARPAWEKPCGGGVTSKALREFPFLQTPDAPKQMVNSLRLITAQKRELTVTPSQEFAIFSRTELAKLMRQRALEAGATLHCERVEKTERVNGHNGHWQITTPQRTINADFLVGADGANSVTRRRVGIKFTEADFAYALGWLVQTPANQRFTQVDIEYLGDLAGYIWLFPRTDHISYGIATGYRVAAPADLKARLLAYIKTQQPDVAAEIAAANLGSTPRAQFYAAMIPSLTAKSWDKLMASSVALSWALIGDAAGFVDPVTEEGIYYSLKSASLLSDALSTTNIRLYEDMWRSSFGSQLYASALIKSKFYSNDFLGAPFIERMIQISKIHLGTRKTLEELITGEQGYTDLKSKLVKRIFLI